MKEEDKIKTLIEVIKRYDLYINSCNAKIAIILSYCMAYIGGVGFKAVDIFSKFNSDHLFVFIILFSVLVTSILVTLVAASKAYDALSPNINNGRATHEQPSLIFFGDVSEYIGGRDGYAKRWEDLSNKEMIIDLSHQAYVLAKIASLKFSYLSESIKLIVNRQLPMLFVTLLFFVGISVFKD